MKPLRYLFFALLCVLCGPALAAGAKPPNILFILADDWGWGDLSCHGNKLVQTPNIDGLARAGTEFYQFNTLSPVCSPSRTAFMTGNFPARFSIHEAIGAAAKNREVGQVDWLDPQATTLPRLLKTAGYTTGHFGKWHLSGVFKDSPLPAAYGVDEHAIFTGPATATQTDHRKVFDDAVAFIRAHKSGPFYMNLWIHETHLAHMPTEESLQRYAKLDEQQRVYSAVVADGDNGIGKVLGVLKELALEQNTLVIFSSDNGPENTGRDKESRGELRGGYGGFYSVGSTGGSRGRKRSLYEGGVRLPFIVRWPGHVPAGKVNKTTALAAVDLLPTLCAVTGTSLPAGYKTDGENLLPALLGQETARTMPIFWDWRGKDTPADCWPRWAVRDGDWKLVTDNASRKELYHSPDDWAEGRNVAKEHADIVAKLSAKLEAWKTTLPKEPAQEFISKEGRVKRRVHKPAADKRAEIRGAAGWSYHEGKGGIMQQGVPYYLGWRYKFELPENKKRGRACFQWKSYAERGKPESFTQNYPLTMSYNGHELSPTKHGAGGATNRSKVVKLWSHPVKIGTWVDVVLVINPSRDEKTGYVEIYFNGEQQKLTTGGTRDYCKTMDGLEVAPKWGAYNKNAIGTEITVDLADLRIGTALESVMPKRAVARLNQAELSPVRPENREK